MIAATGGSENLYSNCDLKIALISIVNTTCPCDMLGHFGRYICGCRTNNNYFRRIKKILNMKNLLLLFNFSKTFNIMP